MHARPGESGSAQCGLHTSSPWATIPLLPHPLHNDLHADSSNSPNCRANRLTSDVIPHCGAHRLHSDIAGNRILRLPVQVSDP